MTHRTGVGFRVAFFSLAPAVVSALASCAHAPAPAPLRAPAPPSSVEGWSYEVIAAPGGAELAVEASFPPGTLDELTVEEGGEPFLDGVEGDTGSGFAPLPSRQLSWFMPPCPKGCRLRYKVALGKAARANGAVTVARAHPGAVDAPPSTWLLRPVRAPLGTPIRFHVTPAPGEAFVSGVFPSPTRAKDTYEAQARSSFQLPYSAFGKLRVHERLGGVVQIAVLPGRTFRDEAAVLAWVETAAKAVAAYYGRFPVPRLLVLVRPAAGDGVGFGTAIGGSGAAIAIDVGEACTPADFKDDWVLVHEMIHTALPDLEGPHHWLEEGLSTYVEPLARSRAGLFGETDLWKDWLKGMQNGLPQPGDQGLDVTHTWGRTYWGGALFCLLADLEIRSRTGGRKSLDDALRAVVSEGGNIAASWPIARVIAIGDRATGVPVLAELYAKMATSPSPVDLPEIWRRLGIAKDARGDVAFDDAAPLAAIRRAMTTPTN